MRNKVNNILIWASVVVMLAVAGFIRYEQAQLKDMNEKNEKNYENLSLKLGSLETKIAGFKDELHQSFCDNVISEPKRSHSDPVTIGAVRQMPSGNIPARDNGDNRSATVKPKPEIPKDASVGQFNFGIGRLTPSSKDKDIPQANSRLSLDSIEKQGLGISGRVAIHTDMPEQLKLDFELTYISEKNQQIVGSKKEDISETDKSGMFNTEIWLSPNVQHRTGNYKLLGKYKGKILVSRNIYLY